MSKKKKPDFENMSREERMKYEIAEELGITKPAVHYAMKGALKKMRKSF